MSAREAELRRAIVADPDNHELRLVYADRSISATRR